VAALQKLSRDTALRSALGGAAKADVVGQGLTWEHNAARVTSLAKRAIAARA
jgi:hypothetical protein